ncbi:hypothetical protein QR680_001183 [Steinernema hermaphroditum]|uniref:DDT domain-containing protein n=1 Tax=Steinernema hermaphroditum TaxID=289476 RepID=A0AA39GY46_9BILA|nr:hypothetical protein QR680_001183 [Steinernema hermaphroditum]
MSTQATRRSSRNRIRTPVVYEGEPPNPESTPSNRSTPMRSTTSRTKKSEKVIDDGIADFMQIPDFSSSDEESKDGSESDEQSMNEDYGYLEDEEVDCGGTEEEINEEDFSEDEDVPDFELPVGSDDIPLEPEHMLDAFEVYETCRTHYRLLLLSPFCIEDFVRVLRSHEQSRLLAEIHIAFLKFALRDDEEEQMIMASNDLNPSFSLLVALLEPMTYAEVLRQYVESDTLRFPKNVRDILNETNYPFCSAKERLVVLKFLCSRFYESAIFRHSARQELKYKHDDYCRDCSLHRSAISGILYKCSFCEAIYHSSCLEQMNGCIPAETEDWLCLICEVHRKIPGVSISDLPPENTNLRLEQLGEDRHNRVYWFVGRRILVVDPADRSVTYYSTLPQFCPLTYLLGDGRYEKRLHRRLTAEFDRIDEEMRMTIDLTVSRHNTLSQQKQDLTRDIYLILDNVIRVAQIYHKYKAGLLDERENILASAVRNACGIDEDGHLFDNFWVGSYTEAEIAELGKQLVSAPRSSNIEDLIRRRGNGFRLGLIENDFRSYENQYACNDYARSPQLRAKERDRKKYMNVKFALDVNFAWTCPKGRDLFGPAFQTSKSLQWTLDEVRKKIPKALFHRLWPEYSEKFKADLDNADTVEKLKLVLLKMECAIRKPVFSSVWWNSLGHTTLYRYSVEDKDAKKKEESAKNKSLKNSMKNQTLDEDSDVVWVKFRNGVQPKHVLWRVKDEEYRLNGKGQLGGWLWQSRTWKRTFVDQLPVVPRGITAKSDASKFVKNSPEYRAHRLDKLIDRFMYWRKIGDGFEYLEARYEKRREVCFSPMCRLGIKYITYYGPNTGYQQCYNPECRMVFRRFNGPTQGISKVTRPDKLPFARKNLRPKKRYGLEDPFPISDPFTYKSRGSGKSSILNLKAPILRRLARRTAKPNPLYWNIPAPRPTFDNCWRYLTFNAKSLHAIALQLRIMFACIRWSDLPQEEGENKHIVHGVDGEEQRIVIGHREHPPDGYYEQYKVRIYKLKDADDLDEAEMDECDDSEDYVEGRIRSGRRAKRPKRTKNSQQLPKQTEIVERWIDGVDLKLWEIKNYWQGYSRRQVQASPVVTAPPMKKVKIITQSNGVAPKIVTPLAAKTVLPLTMPNGTPIGKNGTSPNVFRYVKVMNNSNGRVIPLQKDGLPVKYTVVRMAKPNGVIESNGQQADSIAK